MILPFRKTKPRFDASVFVAPNACVIGNVELGRDSSVWFGAIARGDVNTIRVGERTNIQDMTMIHVTHDTFPTILGDEITVGHRAILHGCHVEDRCLIGMGAVVMDGVEVGTESIVAAGSLVTPGTRIPPHSLARGLPARVVRSLTDEELRELRASAERYVELKNVYLSDGFGTREGSLT